MNKQGIDWSKKNMFDGIGRQDLKKKWEAMLDSATVLEDSLKAQMDRDSGKGEIYTCHKCEKIYKRGGGNVTCLVMHYNTCCHYGDEETNE